MLFFCTFDETVYEAAKKIIDREIDGLPVVKEIDDGDAKKYEVVGRITKTNITRMFVESASGNTRGRSI